MSGRYIDADALKNKITELDGGCAIDGTGFDIYTCEVFELIDEVPTADVVEVVHGKWIDKGHYRYCSVCNYNNPHIYNYCPNCGADMRLKGGT